MHAKGKSKAAQDVAETPRGQMTLRYAVLSNIPALGARKGDELRVYGGVPNGVVEVYRSNVFPIMEAGAYLSGPEVESIYTALAPSEAVPPTLMLVR